MPYTDDGQFREVTNWDRGDFAADALQAYYDTTHGGETYGDEGSKEMGEAMQDLLADLHHLSDRAGMDWDQISATAAERYREEVGESEPDREAGS